jgi:hypothetical protein
VNEPVEWVGTVMLGLMGLAIVLVALIGVLLKMA